MSTQVQCAIWGTPASWRTPGPRRSQLTIEDSARAGGSYSIDRLIAERVIPQLDDAAKARLTTSLVKSRQLGNLIPHIGEREVEDALSAAPIPVHERAVSLLRYTADRTERVGTYVALEDHMDGALAWSESTDTTEIMFLAEYLDSEVLLRRGGSGGLMPQCTVSVKGYSLLAEERTALLPYQAFVAMWFDESMDDVYEQGIRPAIEDVGYEAYRVDRTHDIGKIDDAIIREIRRSKFVVADFTQGTDGNRGSVYYEAGYAHGCGIPVISTCHKDEFHNLAFDTRQNAHIAWAAPDSLRISLADRIGALFGEGRHSSRRA